MHPGKLGERFEDRSQETKWKGCTRHQGAGAHKMYPCRRSWSWPHPRNQSWPHPKALGVKGTLGSLLNHGGGEAEGFDVDPEILGTWVVTCGRRPPIST